MALVDLEGSYKSAPPKLTYTPEPDPFANYTDETGSVSTANYSAWNTPAPSTVSAPATGERWNSQYQTYEDYRGNLWDYTYNAWRDPDGNLWDSSTGLWTSVSDSANPLVYRPQVGWRPYSEYADQMQGLAREDAMYQNAVDALPPEGQQSLPYNEPQDFFSRWRAFDRNTVAPTGEYQPPKQTLSGLLMGGIDSVKSGIQQANTYSLGNTPSMLDMERRGRGMEAFKETGMTSFLPEDMKSGQATKAMNAANKYFFDPIAETGAQLTRPALTAQRLLNPGSMAGDYVLDKAGLPTPFGSPASQLKGSASDIGELGSTLKESGGNPLKFGELQQENLRERPLWQQFGAQALYDPTNIVGAGLATKALKGVQATGTAGDIARGLGKVNQAIDVAQSKAGREVLGGTAGVLANMAAGEENTGLAWWQAAALGALGGSATRGAGSLGSKAAAGLAKVQGRAGLEPILGLQMDIVKGPESRNMLDAIRKAADNPNLAVEIDAIRQAAGQDTLEGFVQAALKKGPEGKRLRTAILAAAEKEGVSVGGPVQKAAALTAKAAGKGAIPALGGAVGYMAAPDDASPMERIAYTLGGAAAAFGGEFAIDRVLPRLTKGAKPIALDLDRDAPIAVGLNRPDKLPLRTKIGNELKNRLFLGHFSDDPRVAGIARDYETGRSLVPSQSNVFAESVDARLKSVFPVDKEGRVKGLPYLDEAGEVVGEEAPDIQQIAAVLPHYLDKLTKPQLLALDYARAAVERIASVRGAVDLDPITPAKGVIHGGFYLPRGKSVGAGVEEVRAIPISRGKTGGEVSTEKARKFASKAEGEAAGREYVPLVEALRNYASEQLAKAWDHAAAQQLIDTGLGIPPVAKLSPEVEAEIKLIRAEMRDASKRANELQGRLTTERQVGRFTSRDIRAIDRRVDELKRQALDRTATMAERRIAAGQASSLSRTQLRDSLNAALDAAEASGKADQKLTDLVARASKQEARMAELEQGLRANAGLGEVRQPGVRLPEVTATGPNVDSAVQAASAATEAGRKLAKELRKATSERMGIPVGPASVSATDSARNAVETARNARKAATEALAKARAEAKLGPDERIAAIEAESRSLARQYRELSERAQTTGIRTRAIEDELDGIRQQQAVAAVKIEGLRTAVGRTKADAAAAREGMSQIDLVPLAGYHWPTAVANTFNKRIPRPGRKYLSVEAYDAINDTLRASEATGDASAVGIQLAKLGFSEPALVAKATKAAVLSMGDPGALGKYILDADLDAVAKGEPLVETMAKYGVRFDTGEITTSAHGRTTLTRAIENSPVLGKGILEPSNRIFDNTGNFARIDLFKTLYRTWKAVGIDADAPEALKAIAKSTNLATGYSRSSVLGGPVGSRVLFAGRFFKSQLDTIGDAVTKGGIEGTVARQQLARMIGLGSLLTVAANEARGHETEFRPWEPNFMRIRDVGGHDISLFGPWDSLARGVVTDDWNDFEHWRDFGRSKSGPIVSAAWDLWEGKSYIGDATTTRIKVGKTSVPVPKALWAAEKVTPFGLANAIEEFIDAGKGKQSFGDAVVGATAEFLGLKSSPLTGYEKQLANMKNGWDTYAPTGYKKPKSMQDDPLFLRKWASENAEKLAGPSTELGKRVKEIEKEFSGKATANDDAFVAGEGVDSEGNPRDWTLGDWKDRRRELQIEKRRAYLDLLGEREGDAKPGTPAYWVQTYFETFDAAESDLGLDFETLDRAQADWLAEHGDAALEYVQEYLQTGKSEPERQYLKAIQQLNKDGYFDMPKYIGLASGESEEEIDRLRALVSERSDEPKYAPYANASYRDRAALVLIDYWKEQGKTLEEVKPIFFDVINAGSDKYQHPRRELYRYRNPQLVEWLDNGNHYATLQAIAAGK